VSRGSAISRVRQYFKEAPLDEVEIVAILVQKDLAERKRVVSKPAVTAPRKRIRPSRAAVPPPPPLAQPVEEEVIRG
jgi:hypothetical protein